MSVLDVTRQRSAFTDALRPPPGHVLGACLGTTYSLDFEAFTAVVLAFVGAQRLAERYVRAKVSA